MNLCRFQEKKCPMDGAVCIREPLCMRITELEANNKNLTEKNAFLRQRPDLPVDRIPAYKERKAKL
jgi:hypothetical protein